MRISKTCLLFLFIGFQFLAKTAFGETDFSQSDRMRYLRFSKEERSQCIRMSRQGENAGVRNYRYLFRSCTDFLLSQGSYDVFFAPQAPGLNTDERCYDDGFRTGFVMESVRQWTPCADQYIASLTEANRKTLEACKSQGTAIQTAGESLKAELLEGANSEIEPEMIRVFSRAYYASELMHGEKAWEEILKSQGNTAIDRTLCTLSMGSAIEERE